MLSVSCWDWNNPSPSAGYSNQIVIVSWPLYSINIFKHNLCTLNSFQLLVSVCIKLMYSEQKRKRERDQEAVLFMWITFLVWRTLKGFNRMHSMCPKQALQPIPYCFLGMNQNMYMESQYTVFLWLYNQTNNTNVPCCVSVASSPFDDESIYWCMPPTSLCLIASGLHYTSTRVTIFKTYTNNHTFAHLRTHTPSKHHINT